MGVLAAIPAATWAMIGTGATVLSTGLSVIGAIQQGSAASAEAKYQSAIARNNAAIAEQYAQDAETRGEIEEKQYRLKVAQFKGTQRAGYSASGVTLDEGSPLDVISDTAMLGELDALTIRSNAKKEAYGYRVQGANFAAESELYRMRSSSAMTSGYWGAATSLLSGAGSVADHWYRYKQGIS